MAIATTATNYQLLNAWQRLMIESIWHFNQVTGKGAPINQGCNVYVQFEREAIARALNQAVERVSDILNFWPRPAYFTDTLMLGYGVPYQRQVLRLKQLKVIALGTRAASVIQATAGVVYSDTDGDGVDETATVTVATTVTDADEIQVFFRPLDGAPAAADPRYQIEPLAVTISGGAATITGHRALFARPDTIWARPYQLVDPNVNERNAADTQVAADFVTAVDVYRVYTDTTTPVAVLGRDNTVLQSFDGVLVDADAGQVMLTASCSAFCFSCCNPPVKVRVSYRAGQSLQYGGMDADLEEAIIRLANTYIPEKFEALCDRTHDRWSQDRRPMTSGDVSVLSPGDARNPLGLLQGQIHAWRVVSARQQPRGGKLTRNNRW